MYVEKFKGGEYFCKPLYFECVLAYECVAGIVLLSDHYINTDLSSVGFTFSKLSWKIFENCFFVLRFLLNVCLMRGCSSLTWSALTSGSSRSPPQFTFQEFFVDPSSQDSSQTGTKDTSSVCKCTNCESLWIKASAKSPKCK